MPPSSKIFKNFSSEITFFKKGDLGLQLWVKHLANGEALDTALFEELFLSRSIKNGLLLPNVIARRWIMPRLVCHPAAYEAMCESYLYHHLSKGVTHMRHMPDLLQPSATCLKYLFAAKLEVPSELLHDIINSKLVGCTDATALALLLSSQELDKLCALVDDRCQVLELAHSIHALIAAKDCKNMVFELNDLSQSWFECKAYRNLRRSGIRETARNRNKKGAHPVFIEKFVSNSEVDVPPAMAAMAIEYWHCTNHQETERVRSIVNDVSLSHRSALQLWFNPKENNNDTSI